MKKNFYKEYERNKIIARQYKENKKIIIEKANFFTKLLQYLVAFIKAIVSILLFFLVLTLLSVGATFIFNVIVQTNLME